MGWTSVIKKFKYAPVEAVELCEGIDLKNKAVCVAYNSVEGAVYAALKAPDGSVVGVVFLVETRKLKPAAPGHPDMWEHSVKSMGEESGPYYWRASAKVLKALSPAPEGSLAASWRLKCTLDRANRKELARRKKEGTPAHHWSDNVVGVW